MQSSLTRPCSQDHSNAKSCGDKERSLEKLCSAIKQIKIKTPDLTSQMSKQRVSNMIGFERVKDKNVLEISSSIYSMNQNIQRSEGVSVCTGHRQQCPHDLHQRLGLRCFTLSIQLIKGSHIQTKIYITCRSDNIRTTGCCS